MSYCVNCGVELAPSEKNCPLCGTPVINPPQTGILGVDCIVERVRTVDGQITVYPAMGLSLTYDHRALDGAPASRFLQDMRAALENFQALLIG